MERALLNDPDHWRQQAHKRIHQAQIVDDHDTKRLLLKAADHYMSIARTAERMILARIPDGTNEPPNQAN